jgi:hypothetical protein
MPDAAYLRRQAEICLRLARRTTDPGMAAELVKMAEEFHAWAAELEKQERGGSARDPEGNRDD